MQSEKSERRSPTPLSWAKQEGAVLVADAGEETTDVEEVIPTFEFEGFEERSHSIAAKWTPSIPVANLFNFVPEFIPFPADCDLETAPAIMKNMLHGRRELPECTIPPDDAAQGDFAPRALGTVNARGKILREFTQFTLCAYAWAFPTASFLFLCISLLSQNLVGSEYAAYAENLSESMSEVPFSDHVISIITKKKQKEDSKQKSKRRIEPIGLEAIRPSRPAIAQLDPLCEFDDTDLLPDSENPRDHIKSRSEMRKRTRTELLSKIRERVAAREEEKARLMSYIMNKTPVSPTGSSAEKSQKLMPTDEVKMVVSKLRAIYKDDRKLATVLVQALEKNEIAVKKLQSYVGTKDDFTGFMNSIFSPEWVFMFLTMFLGSEKAVLDCIDLLRSDSDDVVEVEAIRQKITNALKDYAIMEDFMDQFIPLVEMFAKILEPICNSLEEATALVRRLLANEETAMEKLEKITQTDRDELTLLLDSIRRCDTYQSSVLFEGIQMKVADIMVCLSITTHSCIYIYVTL
ncbi:unnamed protein product [Dibothriocephalus latus]|uniref:Uncharacterized protein n=1 Tax=Dibothriocephalus latus TaxID=60516 RepID=A0A3P6UUZ7_DIBLA|nr:unnamed protein product [Dibothriocephalus latus]